MYTQPIGLTFQALSLVDIFVVGTDGNLWLENAPWGRVPPKRQLIDGTVQAFQTLPPQQEDTTQLFVRGYDGNLWFEQAPWGKVPPARTLLASNVLSFSLEASSLLVLRVDHTLLVSTAVAPPFPPFQLIDRQVQAFAAATYQGGVLAYVVLGINGDLWIEYGALGEVPPARVQVDRSVQSFQAVNLEYTKKILILGLDGNLWMAEALSGTVPPPRQQVDGNVASFLAYPEAQYVLVLSRQGALWLEQPPFGQVPPARELIATDVVAYQPVPGPFTGIYVLALSKWGELRLYSQPFGEGELIDRNVASPGVIFID